MRLEHTGNNRNVTATWTYPQEFSSPPTVPAFALPASGGAYSSGLTLTSLARPFAVTGAGASSVALYVWDNSSPFSAGHWIEVNAIAIGFWR